MTQKVASKPNLPSNSKTKESLDQKSKETFPTKVVVRRLPPTLTSQAFLEEVSPLPEHTYFNFVNADKSLGQTSNCWAIINFINGDDVILFKERFDDYIFVDAKGNEYPAVVEFAPYQKVPVLSRKADQRENTLDDDVEYKKFLENFENPEQPVAMTVKELLEEVDTKAKERLNHTNIETPLLAYINKFKQEKRKMQEKLREEKRLREIEKRKRDLEKKALKVASNATADGKKATKAESKALHATTKTSKKQEQAPATKSASGSKAAEKPVKTNKSSAYNDDIIVRTLPSAKSKYSTEGQKNKPSDKNKSLPSKTTTAGQKSEHSSANPVKSESFAAADEKNQAQKSKQHADVPVKSQSYSEKEKQPLLTKSSSLASDNSTEVAYSNSKDDISDDIDEKSSNLDLDKSKASKSTRYKERPERQLYNPAARAAERRQKQQPKPTGNTNEGEGLNAKNPADTAANEGSLNMTETEPV